MTETLRFMLALELIGAAALPLATVALGRLPGAGIAFAKPLGLLLLAWLVWLGGVLGIPNTLGLLAGAAGVLVVAGLLVLPLALRIHRNSGDPPGYGRRLLLVSEVAFLGVLALGALFNAYSPDVWNTEKPMDMAVVTATIATPDHPPHSPWQSGEDLNYYYLGHLAIGVLIRLTDVEPSAGYNAALAAVLAMAAVAALGLGAAVAEGARRLGAPVRRPLLAGGLAAGLLLVPGTIDGGLSVLRHDGPLQRLDWFGAARVIPDTINEFPFFSFLLGDLHAHVLVVPWVLLALALIAQVALHGPARGVVRGPVEVAVTGFVLALLYAVNAWSMPIFAGLFLLGLLAWARSPEAAGRRRAAAVHALLVGVAGALFVLPFVLEFEPQPSGAGIVERREGLGDFLLHLGAIYGALTWILAALLLSRLLGSRRRLRILVWGGSALLLAILLLHEADLAGVSILVALLLVALHALLGRTAPPAERVPWLLVAGALACLIAPEVVYVRDEFDDSPLFRMNTVFKMGYHAWILMAVAAGCVLAWGPAWLPRVPRLAWRGGAALLVGIGLVYTVGGSWARKDGFARPPTLEGRGWLAASSPGDVAAIDWIRANTAGDAVVLEATGDDYSPFGHARISTFTGRPTVMGWPGHELQWGHDPRGRREAVRGIYRAPDPATARARLARFGVSYAVLGPLERTDYGDAEALVQAGRLVFSREGTDVYAFHPPAGEPHEDDGATKAPF